MKEFKNKVLVVTGAGSGIGAAIAVEGALRGMKVVINDINPETIKNTEAKIKNIGAEVVCCIEDVSTAEGVKAMFDLTMEKFGQVDILVNNAGVTAPGPIWELPIQDINWITEANFLGHAYGMHYFIPQMIKQGTECAVLNVASGAGMGVSGSSVMYHTTKTADVVLAEGVYLSLKVRGISNIQVHAVCPAFVKTTIHESDKARPPRYADMTDPYYSTDEYEAGLIRATRGVATGIDDDYVGMCVFTGIEDNKFYIWTHPEMPLGMLPRIKGIMNNTTPNNM